MMNRFPVNRPLTHVLYWSCNLLTFSSGAEYRIEAKCGACGYAWSMMLASLYLSKFFLGQFDLAQELHFISRELEEAHKKFKKPDVHFLNPRSVIDLGRRSKIKYRCNKEALYFGEQDPIHYGLDILVDDDGEGFTLAQEKLTCEHCVAAYFDPLVEFWKKQGGRIIT